MDIYKKAAQRRSNKPKGIHIDKYNQIVKNKENFGTSERKSSFDMQSVRNKVLWFIFRTQCLALNVKEPVM